MAASTAFYEVAATLFPIILIGTFLEGAFSRYRAPAKAKPWLVLLGFWSVAGNVLFIVGGEAVALGVLATGNPTDMARSVVELLLATTGGLLVLGALIAPAVDLDSDHEFKRPWGAITLGTMGVAWALGIGALLAF